MALLGWAFTFLFLIASSVHAQSGFMPGNIPQNSLLVASRLTVTNDATMDSLALTGTTSGTVTVQPQAAAGTYNFNLPTAAGSSGQPLLSGGGGSTAMTFGTLSVGGGGIGATTLTSNGVLYGNGAS